MRFLVAIPVYNERNHLGRVAPRVQEHTDDLVFVDDGSTDGTSETLGAMGVRVVRHGLNRGYGAAVRTAFRYAAAEGYDWVLTMDCDGQHEPESIPAFRERAARGGVDLISGTRYAGEGGFAGGGGDSAPEDRRAINRVMTGEINERLGVLLGGGLTDAFCGFKAHRVETVGALDVDEDGYALPMRLWVRAAAARLRVEEMPVARIYNDPSRTFGAGLDDPGTRLAHYRRSFYCELERCADRLPASAVRGSAARCR